MECICNFNPVKDIREVNSIGYIDLAIVLKSGIVPSNLDESQIQYNGIEDPSSIIGSPSDVFEAYRMTNDIISSADADESE